VRDGRGSGDRDGHPRARAPAARLRERRYGRQKIRFQERQAKLPWDARSPDAPFEPVDFEADFDRASSAADNLAKLFADVVGCENIVKRLGTYQAVAQAAKARGKDPRDLVPMGYVFKGPPGRSEIG
jgi:hypothetical protein